MRTGLGTAELWPTAMKRWYMVEKARLNEGENKRNIENAKL